MKTPTVSKKLSLAAVQTSTTTQLREKIYNFILRTGNAGVTDEEICNAFDVSGDTERPRRNELVKSNLIADSGQRRMTSRGRSAIIWKSMRNQQTLNKTLAKTKKRA